MCLDQLLWWRCSCFASSSPSSSSSSSPGSFLGSILIAFLADHAGRRPALLLVTKSPTLEKTHSLAPSRWSRWLLELFWKPGLLTFGSSAPSPSSTPLASGLSSKSPWLAPFQQYGLQTVPNRTGLSDGGHWVREALAG